VARFNIWHDNINFWYENIAECRDCAIMYTSRHVRAFWDFCALPQTRNPDKLCCFLRNKNGHFERTAFLS
jgi:hypothetical protein